MTIALVSSAGIGSSDSTNATTSAINTTGATLIIAAVGVLNQTAVSFSDSAGNTWTALTQHNESGRGSIQGWYCLNPTTSSSHTFTATSTSARPGLAVAAYSGVAALDAQTGFGGTSAVTSAQPGAITPAGNNELFVTAVTGFSAGNAGLAVDSSFTIEQNIARTGTAERIALADLVQTTGTAENPTWSWTSADFPAANMAAFTASGGTSKTLSMSATWPDWSMSANVGAGRDLSAADTWPDWTMSASVGAGRALSAAAIWPDWTMADTATAGRVLSAADTWPDWIMAANVIGPTASNIQLIAKRGHQTPGQPLGFV